MATPRQTEQVEIDNRIIEAFSVMPQSVVDDPNAFRLFWRRFVTLLAQLLTRLMRNDLALARRMVPGDVKLSLVRYDGRNLTTQMPGFVPWVSGLTLSKQEFPGLYRAIGSASATDAPDVETFKLPIHNSGLIQIAAQGDTPSNRAAIIQDGSDYEAVKLSVWIKT